MIKCRLIRHFHCSSNSILLSQILFKVINDSQNYVLLERARYLVRDCIDSRRKSKGGKQSQQQVPTTNPDSALAEAIAIPLRTLVGELHWEKANHYTKIYYSSLHRKRTRMIHNYIGNRAAWAMIYLMADSMPTHLVSFILWKFISCYTFFPWCLTIYHSFHFHLPCSFLSGVTPKYYTVLPIGFRYLSFCTNTESGFSFTLKEQWKQPKTSYKRRSIESY